MNEEQQGMTQSRQLSDNDPMAESAPPPLDEELLQPATSERKPAASGYLNRLAKDFHSMDDRLTLSRIVDALLKHPGRIVFEIMQGRIETVSALLLIVAAACTAIYGLIMGSFSGGPQWWIVPAKVIIGVFLSSLICLPSLHILTSLSGGNQSLGQTASLMLLNLALGGILLVGFAPIAWIFCQSTNSVVFMGGLHVLIWCTGTFFGLNLLKTSLSLLNKQSLGIMTLWSGIFLVVVFQMCTTLRPLVGPFDGYNLKEKQFFLEHWGTSR
ncbi:MAG: hypothetical protein WCN95_14050 [bacterium]